MKVTPQVNNQGMIKLTIEPEVSSRNGEVRFGGGSSGATIPIIGVRKTKTQITLKDGFTLGIGGLVENTNIKSETKVPVLGNIPGLGRLFRSESKDNTTRNLVVFITARTLKPDGATAGEVFDPRMIREMQLTKDELPGFRDGSDPFYQPPAPDKKK
jgi:type IV pilus assembly protein PilQ